MAAAFSLRSLSAISIPKTRPFLLDLESHASDPQNSPRQQASPKRPADHPVDLSRWLERCAGCGAPFHQHQSMTAGFLKNLRDRQLEWLNSWQQSGKPLTCERCDALAQSQSIGLPRFLAEREQSQLLSLVRGKNEVVGLVVDATDFPASLPAAIVENVVDAFFGERSPIFLIANKEDLLAARGKKVSPQRRSQILRWMRATAMAMGLRAPAQSFLVSSITGSGIGQLEKAIRLYTARSSGCRANVFLVGTTNVGKSSLWQAVQKISHKNQVPPEASPTISAEPGTTAGLLRIPLSSLSVINDPKRSNRQRGFLYDTPGLYNAESLLNGLSLSSITKIMTSARREGCKFPLNKGESLTFFCEGVELVEIKSEAEIEVFVQMPTAVEAKRVRSSSLQPSQTLSDFGPIEIAVSGLGSVKFEALGEVKAEIACRNRSALYKRPQPMP